MRRCQAEGVARAHLCAEERDRRIDGGILSGVAIVQVRVIEPRVDVEQQRRTRCLCLHACRTVLAVDDVAAGVAGAQVEHIFPVRSSRPVAIRCARSSLRVGSVPGRDCRTALVHCALVWPSNMPACPCDRCWVGHDLSAPIRAAGWSSARASRRSGSGRCRVRCG